eukprot:gene2815-1800_t
MARDSWLLSISDVFCVLRGVFNTCELVCGFVFTDRCEWQWFEGLIFSGIYVTVFDLLQLCRLRGLGTGVLLLVIDLSLRFLGYAIYEFVILCVSLLCYFYMITVVTIKVYTISFCDCYLRWTYLRCLYDLTLCKVINLFCWWFVSCSAIIVIVFESDGFIDITCVLYLCYGLILDFSLGGLINAGCDVLQFWIYYMSSTIEFSC